jgi:hypothetical protein
MKARLHQPTSWVIPSALPDLLTDATAVMAVAA